MWNMKRPLYVADYFSKKPEVSLAHFHTLLMPFLENKQRNCIFIDAPVSTSIKFVSIGYYNNKYFICSTIKPFHFNSFSNLLLLRPLPELNPFLMSSAAIYHYSYSLDNLNDFAFPLVYVKTAFNTLAYFKGYSFALESIFDPLRYSICNEENLNQFWVNSNACLVGRLGK